MEEQENLFLFQQAEVVTMKEIGSVIVEEIEKIVEEVISREVAVVAVAEQIELNVKEIVREEIEVEICRLAEGKCKCSNQIKATVC